MHIPSFEELQRAAESVARHLPVTPAWSYGLLDSVAGCEVVVKHENVQPTGAFKVRGGVNLAATLSPEDLAHGLVTASTGNHAQSVAYAAKVAGTSAMIVVPEGSPPRKIKAVEALGGTVVHHGPTMTEAVAKAVELAESEGLRFVSPGNEPAIIAGHATVYLELLRQHPDLEAIYIPVGSGSGAAGACLVRDQVAPNCLVIAVQSSEAPAAHDAWSAGRPATAPCLTRHSGLATGASFELPQSVMAGGLADFIIVSDAEIDAAARLLATHAHTLAEGAGAAALAGLLKHADRPAKCAVVVTGGNAGDDELARLAG